MPCTFTPPPKLRNHQKFKRNTQFPLPRCFYKMIICTRNLTHSVSGHKSLNPSLWLSDCLFVCASLASPLFACQNQCKVLLSASAINKIHLDYKVHTKKGPLIRPVSHLAYFSSLKIYLKREQDKEFILYILVYCVRIVANRLWIGNLTIFMWHILMNLSSHATANVNGQLMRDICGNNCHKFAIKLPGMYVHNLSTITL